MFVCDCVWNFLYPTCTLKFAEAKRVLLAGVSWDVAANYYTCIILSTLNTLYHCVISLAPELKFKEPSLLFQWKLKQFKFSKM